MNQKHVLRDMTLVQIAVGDTASFTHTFTDEDVEIFAKLSGDMNPLHMDEAYAQKTKFKGRLVHGMLVASLCSTLVGMYMPGKNSVYLSQELRFRRPVFIGDMVSISGIVKSKSLSTGIVEISISISKSGEEVISGQAKVQMLA